MINLKYTVPVISAHTLISHAEKTGENKYRFRLALDTDANVSAVQMSQQDECAMLHMALELLKKKGYPQHVQTRDLSSVIVYIDFKGIFDRDPKFTKAAEKQKKAEAMFTSDGIELDFGLGYRTYLAFERSASMSRDCRLSFVCKDYLDELRGRMMLGMTIGKCQLSKLYAYNGLMFTSGFRYEDKSIWNSRRIVVVDNPVTTVNGVDVITVEDDGSGDSVRRYRRVEQKTAVDVLEFDGEGLISFELADSIDNMYVGAPLHSSFQIRMPYIKGVVHKVDYKAMFRELGVEYIIDLWGERHNISEVDMILTKSMFKGFGWMTENGLTWGEYLKRCERYGHALYISGTNQLEPQTQTELNYQFITTASITAEEFRPLDLPDGWESSPEGDSRQWITKETEVTYYNYLANPEFRKQYYLSALNLPYGDEYNKRKVMARILQKNERFINESIYIKELEDRAASIVNKYAIGRLLISGDNRYLSGDLMRFMHQLVQKVVETDSCYADAAAVLEKECSTLTTAYAPGAAYPEQEIYTLLRNPHIARNEEVMVTSPEFIGPLREKYLSHLTYLIMVDSRTLIPERLGGADFDGDMIRTIADPLLNSCVLRNHDSREFDPFGFGSGIPLLKIPAAEPQIRDASDWFARFEVIKGTFSSRIGQICNAAFDRSVIAYDENAIGSFGERCRQETETLAILTGLEIDSAKSGIKPDLTEYIGQGFSRSSFLKYKKRDTSYLGRFTFKTLLDFEGIGRMLTIIARGYLFHDRDGSLLDGDAYARADYAYRALCAWCSIPERKNATPKAEWQSKSDFHEYHEEFPELVNAKGEGWFYRHVHGITRFVKNNPDLVSDSAQKSCQQLAKGFDKQWRDKVVHYQVPLFTPSTRASWGIRFEGIVADALTLGPLRKKEPDISPELMERVSSLLPKGVPADVVCMLIAYYKANKPEDSDWVVLPVAAFDAYYGNTNFSRKYLSKIPKEIMKRSEQKLGVGRYRITLEYLT